LILLLLFGIGCRPAELVDTKKKRKNDISSNNNDLEIVDNNNILAIDKSNKYFGTKSNKDFSSRDNNTLQGIVIISRAEENIRYFDAICYKDIRLLVVRSPSSREREGLAIEVIIAYHKRHKRRPKP
jgi:hypothetical protein